MALVLCLTLLPTAALADELGPVDGTSTVETAGADAEAEAKAKAGAEAVAAVQAMIDALPEEITADDADIADALAAIEGEMAALSEDQRAALDVSRYEAALAALEAQADAAEQDADESENADADDTEQGTASDDNYTPSESGGTAEVDKLPSPVQAMIDALPDELTEENAEDVSAKLGEIDAAMAALGDEERAALDLTQYQAAIAALAALAAAQGEIALYADDINKPRNGTGTTEDPYQIASTDEMEWFRDTVNAGNTTICAELMSDLNFSDKQSNGNWTWTPIGNSEVNAYVGMFDGNGYEIKEIRLVDVQAQSQTNRGLFGWIGTGGKVQDLAVSVKYVGNSSLAVSDSGLLSVNNAGTIERCSATISNALYTDSFGMIAYKNSGKITDCLSYVSATGNKLSISGKAAGIARTNTGTISNCFFRGSFRTGKTDYAIAENKNGSITNCYYRDANNGRNGEVYIDGNKDTGDTVVWKSTSECNSGEVAWLLNNSGSRDTWRMGSNKYPSLKKTDGRVNKNQDGSYNIGDKPHMHGDVEFTKVAALSDIKATGNYYIDAAVDVSSTWEVNGDVVLCLNGQTVTAKNEKAPAIKVSGNNRLKLLDCKEGKITGSGGTSILVDGGSLTLGGKAQITGNDKNILLAQGSKISFDSLDPSAKFGISVENQKDLSDPVAVTDATGGQYFGQLVADGFKDNGVGFELYLSDDGKTVMLGKQSAHTHCICGGRNTNLGHTSHSDVTFQPWRETDKLPTSGNYYLTRNVTLTKNATLQNANVCLNGYTVTLSDVGRINPSGTTQLTDCSVDGKLESYLGKANGGVAISGGSKFYLYGGTLNGVKVEIGQTDGGTFNMYGGKITGNTQGTVVGQSKTSGNQSALIINMYGGEISGNHIVDQYGGGVFVGSGNQFNMYGGTIQNNSAVDGGGVYIAPAGNAYSAGEMTICGDAVIQGNKAGSVLNNVSLPSGKQITISGKLVENAKIGVTTRANLSQGNVNIATATDAGWVVAKNFTSDNSAYDVGLVNDGKTVQLQVHSHQWKYTANGATITAACKAPSCLAPAGGSVTINKPAHTTYGDGQSENATLTENNWQGLAVNQIAITYKKGNDILKTAPTDAGTYTANITLDGATASVKYTIAKAVPKVEDFTFAAPKDLVYNGQAKSAEVKAKDSVKGMGNITVKYYQSETEVEPINAGRYIVKISVEEGTNYATATDLKIGELTISGDTLPEGTGTDKSVTIRYNDTEVKTYTYTDFGFTAAGTFAVKGSVTEGTSLLATGYPKFESNGVQVKLATGLSLDGSEKKVVIPMTFTPNGGNYKHKEVTLTITLADKVTDTKTMTVTQKDFVYGEETVNPQITGVEGTPTFTYKSDKAGAAESSEKPTDAGKYTVTAVLNTADTIYTASADFEIMAKSISGATVDAITGLAYNGTAHTPTPAVKMGSTALANATDYTLSYSENTNAGTATMTVTALGNDTFTETVNFDICQATLTVTPTGGQSKKFGATDPTLTYTTSGVVGSQIPSFTGKLSRAEGEDVGQYDITLGTLAMMNHDSSGFKASNYTLKMVSPAVKFEITKGTYGGSAPTTTVNILKNYAGVQTGTLTAADFFTTAPAEAKITVLPSPGTVTIMSSVDVDASGNLTYHSKPNIAATADENCAVTISSKNYTDINATLTFKLVDKTDAGVTISSVPASKTYGESFTLTASVTDAGTGTVSWTWTSNDPSVLQVTGTGASATVKALKAGSATISAKYESDTTMGEQTTASITVGKRVITVTADNKSMTVNGTLPTFTVTYGNLPSGVQAADIFGTLASASTTTDGKTTGSFDITVTTPVLKTEAGANYEVGAVTKGTLTVNPRSSSGGGGGSSVSTYSVTVGKTENGSISVSPKSASKGDTVTVTVTPDKGYTLETLTVLDKKGKELKLTEKNGKYTFTMPAGKVEVKVTFMDDNTMLNYFVDVKADNYFYDAVKWAAEKGITSGTDATHFGPNAVCTRAQIVTFLWRTAGSPEPKSTGSFADVPTDSYYAKAVAWAVENGITGGTGDGKFSPNATCTREQAVAFLYRTSGSPAVSGNATFSDVAANAYYADAVKWAEKNEITSGIGGGLFGSGNDCTRAQIVTFLYRTYQGK